MPIVVEERAIPWEINCNGRREKRIFTLEREVYEPNTEPKLFFSPKLSNETGLEVYVLDYSCTDVHTHKLEKALHTLKNAKENKKNLIFYINTYESKEKNSKGSGRDALELASATIYPESQVINFVHNKESYFKIEPIHPYFPASRKSIEIGINLETCFWDLEKLEKLFYESMKGNKMKPLREFLEKRGLAPLDKKSYCDATNLPDSLLKCNIYKYSSELIEQLKEFDFHAGSAGTSERALNQINSLKGKKLVHIIVVSKGHSLDPAHKYAKVGLSKIQTPYLVEAHKEIIKEANKRKDVFFKFVTPSEVLTAKNLFADEFVKEHLGLEQEVKTSIDGAAGFTVLRSRKQKEHGSYFTEKGMRVLGAYYVLEGVFNYHDFKKGLIMPYGSKVCIVNTGCSSNEQLKKLIEKGMVK